MEEFNKVLALRGVKQDPSTPEKKIGTPIIISSEPDRTDISVRRFSLIFYSLISEMAWGLKSVGLSP